MSALIHTIYASRATAAFEEHQIPELLAQTRSANAARDVTGILLYIEGSFFQVLEGEESVVASLYEKIRLDVRHTRMTQIIREPIVERDFAEWTMGFSTVSLDDVKNHLGDNGFFTSANCIEQLSAGRAKKLLMAFRSGRWRTEQTGMHRLHRRVT